MAKTGRGRRSGRFSHDEGLKEAIRELALDTAGGARTIAAALPEEERPSYVVVQAILNQLGLGTRVERLRARREAGLGERPVEGAVGLWEEAYLESREWVCGGTTVPVSFILDRATASARVAIGEEAVAVAWLITEIREKEACLIARIVISRGGMRRKKVGPELEKLLVEGGIEYKVEGRWGAMNAHRQRLRLMIDEGLAAIGCGAEAEAAAMEAVRRYNEEVPYEGFPTFGETPDRAWVRQKLGKRPGIARTTREAKRGG